MRVIYVPSAVKKPFGFIDRSVVAALKKRGMQVEVVPPDSRPEKQQRTALNGGRPDLLIAMLGIRLTKEQLQWIETLSVPRVIWYTDDPYAIDASLRTCRRFDWVFTNESEAVPVYLKAGARRVKHLPLAAPYPSYSPVKRPSLSHRSQIVLVGSAFRNRLTAVGRLAGFLGRYRTRLVGPGWKPLAAGRGIFVRNEWVTAEEAREYYGGADIVLNIHRSYRDPHLRQNRSGVRAETPNNRLFEIAACRAFQLIDHRRDLELLYEPEKEIVPIRSMEEFKEKIRFYLPRRRLREEIAERAFRRTLAEHLYEHRVDEIIRTVFG